jgi:hypothetical protein
MLSLLLAASLTTAPIVTLRFNVREFGLRGKAMVVVDRRSGRYARRFEVGAASDTEAVTLSGYDAKAANGAFPSSIRIEDRQGARELQLTGVAPPHQC